MRFLSLIFFAEPFFRSTRQLYSYQPMYCIVPLIQSRILSEYVHQGYQVTLYCCTQAVGTGERDAAKAMAAVPIPGAHQKTLGADMNYESKGMVAELRRLGVMPYEAKNTARPGGSAIDGRTTRHDGYAQSINARRGI